MILGAEIAKYREYLIKFEFFMRKYKNRQSRMMQNSFGVDLRLFTRVISSGYKGTVLHRGYFYSPPDLKWAKCPPIWFCTGVNLVAI